MQNKPAGILKNAKLDRFHPILFRYGPAPSSDASDDVQRYKSSGHHTAGFDTEEEAKAFISELGGYANTGCVWEWDGEDIPAIVQWFSTTSLEMKDE